MTVLEILTYPDERLKDKSHPVTDFGEELQYFVKNLDETRRAGPAAVGIAAPQVGCLQRIVIIDASGKEKIKHHGYRVLINPVITRGEGDVIGREGCLSVPDYTGNVLRAERIAVEAQDINGELQQLKMEGFEARLVQHEIDHLDGLLFLDRLVSRRDLYRRKVYK